MYPWSADRAEGFIYCVSLTGITGIQGNLSNNIESFINEVIELSQIPVAVGFGITTPEQGATMAKDCDGIIVGSALVKVIEENGIEAVEALSDFG